MLTTKPRRVTYLLAAAVLIAVFFFLYTSTASSDISSSLDILDEQSSRRSKSRWNTADNVAQRPIKANTDDGASAPLKVLEDDRKQEDNDSSSGFDEAVYSFQKDLLDYHQPRALETLAKLAPKFYDPSAKHHGPTYATYLSTRNSSTYDPYFLAAEQLVYRTLWKPESATREGYPFTVFVAPFITQEQRDLLAGAGANVVELPLVDWKPTVAIYARWRDLFSKLHMWAQMQFSRIAFLDSDAFPLKPLDDIFEVSEMQRCKKELITHPEDKANEKELCDFVFAGSRMMYVEEINVGVTVFNPNKAMHKRLLREASDPSKFDNNMAEQAFLNMVFSRQGPFPTQIIPREYNGFWANEDEEDKLKVVHEKLWAFLGNAKWAEGLFEKTHNEMVRFYESDEFKRRRKTEAGKTMKQLRNAVAHEN